MATIVTRVKPISTVTGSLPRVSVYLPRVAPPSIAQARMISSGPKEDGDLGGPGGSEATPERFAQNRRLALTTGVAVLATLGAYSVMTGRAEKIAAVPTKSVEDVVKNK